MIQKFCVYTIFTIQKVFYDSEQYEVQFLLGPNGWFAEKLFLSVIFFSLAYIVDGFHFCLIYPRNDENRKMSINGIN